MAHPQGQPALRPDPAGADRPDGARALLYQHRLQRPVRLRRNAPRVFEHEGPRLGHDPDGRAQQPGQALHADYLKLGAGAGHTICGQVWKGHPLRAAGCDPGRQRRARTARRGLRMASGDGHAGRGGRAATGSRSAVAGWWRHPPCHRPGHDPRLDRRAAGSEHLRSAAGPAVGQGAAR